MAHSLSPPPPPAATSPSPISARTRKKDALPILGLDRQIRHQGLTNTQENKASTQFHDRRGFIYGLIGAGLGLSFGPDSANAAKRRPPPPPPGEKKDPNISGVQAKVLASIKRKEAMKEAVANERGKGKPLN